MRPLSQPALFAALQVASLGGAALGLAALWQRADGPRRRVLFAVSTLLAWRVSYFPIMVFSGHLASIAEWLLASFLLPLLVYPVYLLAAAILHGAAAAAAVVLVDPPVRWLRWLAVPPFAVAVLISFNSWSDLHPLPDTNVHLERHLEHPHAPEGNPYLPALDQPGYTVNQRLMLVAAGLTYDTIPNAPWATAVKSALEELFRQHPHASTTERLCEHYLAYHSAQAWLGCRRLADCPLPP
jgi:hypothetical protein